MKKYKRKFIKQRFFTYLLIPVFVWFIFILGRGIIDLSQKYKVTKLDRDYIKREVDKIELEYENNLEKLENIKTEEGQEEFIRETYPVKKEGEKVVVIYNVPSFTYEIPKKGSNWKSLPIKSFLENIILKIKHVILNK